MKFNRLRLLGFKSFVEPTEFVIERGLTGIVGPNGCGKSNLVEAMRWVMGENSYKNMRASGMDDVIFSGSGNRPARNTAEVGLYLDNSDRTAPAAFNDQDEVQVTRRIERESGSVYRINGKEARAKDVQLLFADASTGARSPSMVGQGRIGELIQAKPQARRQLLEEAAGISGLHSRRHEAELRLRAAETNLERLDDVTSELESQIESLKRQARQANRFRSLSAEIRQLEATLLHIRWKAAKEQEAEAESALSQATSLVAQKAQEQMEAAKAQAIAAHKLPELREAEANAAAALQRLQIARTQIEEEATRVARRKTELEERVRQLETDMERENVLIADNAGVLARLSEEENELNAALEASGGRSVELKETYEGAAAQLADSEAELARITGNRAEAAAERSQLEKSIRELAERRQRLESQIARQDAELSALAERIAGLPDPVAKKADVERATETLAAAEVKLADIEAALEAARAAETEARGPVAEAKARLNAAETEARTIARMLNAGASSDLFPPVLEKIKVDRGFETALGAALGDDLELPTDDAAPAYWSLADGGDDPLLPAIATPLLTHVRAPGELSRRLGQIGIVSDFDTALSLKAQLKPGQRLVTKDGAMVRWDGYVASADAPTAAAMRLEQKNRLAELDAEVIEATTGLRQAEDGLRQASEKLAALSNEQRTARDAIREATSALGRARDELAKAERAAGELSNRREVLTESRAQVGAQLAEAVEAHEGASRAMADAPDLSDLDRALAEIQAKVAGDRATVAEARAAHEGLERENAGRRNRLASIANERQGWIDRAAKAESHLASLAERLTGTREEAEKIADAPDEIDLKRRQLMSELTKAETARKEAADKLAVSETASREADKVATEAITALSQSREGRGRAEERLMAARERREEGEARIREALNCSPHEAIRQSGLKPDDALPDPAILDRNLDRLRVERERLGAVNLRADEEQAELSERLNLIVTEREDVIEAIRKLRAGIQSLNREGRERLLAAFTVVNDQFQRLFTHLFGGGTAELQLIESDDPLEAGLEILARPPGKKPQTMTLLSGGEQALTAMALIFAVFLTNPAPICVLDEVDAPLDEHNVERYCNLMDEMARTTETRFVIITHNPITMARMNRLFGVTMAEQGVSQLVSVDLETAEQLREAS